MKSFFETFPITKIEYSEIDIWIEKPGFKILFLWGVNCPNCEIAKKVLTEYLSEVFEWEKNIRLNGTTVMSTITLNGRTGSVYKEFRIL